MTEFSFLGGVPL